MLLNALKRAASRTLGKALISRVGLQVALQRASSSVAPKPAPRIATPDEVDLSFGGLRCTSAEPPSPLATLNTAAAHSDEAWILSLIEKRRPQWSLDREFYLNEAAYRLDLRYIWNRSWLFAGFSINIPKPGDYFVYNVGDESIIIVRGQDGKPHAYHNVCRHRGSRICLEERGSAAGGKKLVCPYHQWSYSVDDGALISAPKMNLNENFSASDFPLHPAAVRECEGLLWVAMSSDTAPPFDDAASLMTPHLRPHRLGDPSSTKIAHEAVYDIAANWKLVYENNRECYHCPVGHPEYSRANYDTAYVYQRDPASHWRRVIDPNDPRRPEIEAQISECSVKWTAVLGNELVATPDSSFPGPGWYRASRAPMRRGWVTESLDGRPVAPLMGLFREISEKHEQLRGERDFGSLRIHTLPNFWIHASGDHAVATRLTPNGPRSTKAVVTWLVAADAVEGRDYTLDKMLPFWQLTSEQDWRLCEANQKGVESSRYTPGPLSEVKEAGLEKFVGWYLKKMKSAILGKDI